MGKTSAKKAGQHTVRPFLKKDFETIMQILDDRVQQASENRDSMDYYIARRNYMIFRLGVNFGLRQSDLMALTTDSVANGVLQYTAQKTGKSDYHEYNNELWEEIQEYEKEFKMRPGDYLFRGAAQDGKHLRKTHLGRKQLRVIIKDVAKEAGVRYSVATHSFRKSYATWLYEDKDLGSDDITIVKKALQHSRAEETEHYLGFSSETLRKVQKKVNFGAPQKQKKGSKKQG